MAKGDSEEADRSDGLGQEGAIRQIAFRIDARHWKGGDVRGETAREAGTGAADGAEGGRESGGAWLTRLLRGNRRAKAPCRKARSLRTTPLAKCVRCSRRSHRA